MKVASKRAPLIAAVVGPLAGLAHRNSIRPHPYAIDEMQNPRIRINTSPGGDRAAYCWVEGRLEQLI